MDRLQQSDENLQVSLSLIAVVYTCQDVSVYNNGLCLQSVVISDIETHETTFYRNIIILIYYYNNNNKL